MAILKNEIPILEFDTNKSAVIEPNHEGYNISLPKKAVIAFLYKEVESYASKNKAVKIGNFITCSKNTPIYITTYKGEEIAFCQAPVGSSAVTALMDWLIAYGAKEIIATGSCGTLIDMEENQFLVPTKALRDEGASYKYMMPSRYAFTSKEAVKAIEKTFKSINLPYMEVVTWTTDGFFRETKDMVEYRKNEGCQVVEMECASMCAVAHFRNIVFGQILFTADTLANVDSYQTRDFGINSSEKALMLALDAVSRIETL